MFGYWDENAFSEQNCMTAVEPGPDKSNWLPYYVAYGYMTKACFRILTRPENSTPNAMMFSASNPCIRAKEERR